MTQEFSAKQGLKYELSLRLIQKQSSPFCLPEIISHTSIYRGSAGHSIEIKGHCFRSGQFSHFIAMRGRMFVKTSCGE